MAHLKKQKYFVALSALLIFATASNVVSKLALERDHLAHRHVVTAQHKFSSATLRSGRLSRKCMIMTGPVLQTDGMRLAMQTFSPYLSAAFLLTSSFRFHFRCGASLSGACN